MKVIVANLKNTPAYFRYNDPLAVSPSEESKFKILDRQIKVFDFITLRMAAKLSTHI